MAETYLIEIREGTGEPAFIELKPGVELAPLGVGSEGAWRVRSAGVLGVHLYLYFDGQALFAQSADPTKPAVVNGRTVGAAWTPLTAPATIALGTARLFFRTNAKPEDDDDEEDKTIAQAPPSEAVSDDAADEDRTIAVAPPVRTAAPARPFVPGAFSSRSDESTRFAPIGDTDDGPDSQSTRIVPLVEGLAETPGLGTPAVRAMGPAAQRPGVPVRPAAGVPWSGPGGPVATGSPGGSLVGNVPPMVQRTTAPDFARQPEGGEVLDPSTASYPRAPVPPPPNDGLPAGPFPRPPPGYADSRAQPIEPAPPTPAGPPPGLLNLPPPPSAPAPQAEGSRLGREWKAAPTTRKILYVALLPALAGAFWVIFSGNEPPPAQTKAKPPPSASTTTSAATQAPPPSNPPPNSPPTPPPNPPPNAPPNPPPTPPPPSTPAGGTTTPPPGGQKPPENANASTADASADASERRERQAADYVATGQYELAAQLYDQLAKDKPNNPAFAEAARILRTKADAGIR